MSVLPLNVHAGPGNMVKVPPLVSFFPCCDCPVLFSFIFLFQVVIYIAHCCNSLFYLIYMLPKGPRTFPPPRLLVYPTPPFLSNNQCTSLPNCVYVPFPSNLPPCSSHFSFSSFLSKGSWADEIFFPNFFFFVFFFFLFLVFSASFFLYILFLKRPFCRHARPYLLLPEKEIFFFPSLHLPCGSRTTLFGSSTVYPPVTVRFHILAKSTPSTNGPPSFLPSLAARFLIFFLLRFALFCFFVFSFSFLHNSFAQSRLGFLSSLWALPRFMGSNITLWSTPQTYPSPGSAGIFSAFVLATLFQYFLPIKHTTPGVSPYHLLLRNVTPPSQCPPPPVFCCSLRDDAFFIFYFFFFLLNYFLLYSSPPKPCLSPASTFFFFFRRCCTFFSASSIPRLLVISAQYRPSCSLGDFFLCSDADPFFPYPPSSSLPDQAGLRYLCGCLFVALIWYYSLLPCKRLTPPCAPSFMITFSTRSFRRSLSSSIMSVSLFRRPVYVSPPTVFFSLVLVPSTPPRQSCQLFVLLCFFPSLSTPILFSRGSLDGRPSFLHFSSVFHGECCPSFSFAPMVYPPWPWSFPAPVVVERSLAIQVLDLTFSFASTSWGFFGVSLNLQQYNTLSLLFVLRYSFFVSRNSSRHPSFFLGPSYFFFFLLILLSLFVPIVFLSLLFF